MLEHVSTQAFDDPVVKRAKRAIRKRRHFQPRMKLFIKMPMLKQIFEVCYVGSEEEKKFGMLFLIAYIFLLRVPSEASTHPLWHGGLPVARDCRRCPSSAAALGVQSLGSSSLSCTLTLVHVLMVFGIWLVGVPARWTVVLETGQEEEQT